jgi:hypothetical protein
VEDHDPSFWMIKFLYLDMKPEFVQYPNLNVSRISKCLAPNNPPWMFIGNAEDNFTSAFICERNTVSKQPGDVELVLRLFELEAFMLTGNRQPSSQLFEGRRHQEGLAPDCSRMTGAFSLHSSIVRLSISLKSDQGELRAWGGSGAAASAFRRTVSSTLFTKRADSSSV